jgi:hypothetical protein
VRSSEGRNGNEPFFKAREPFKSFFQVSHEFLGKLDAGENGSCQCVNEGHYYFGGI